MQIVEVLARIVSLFHFDFVPAELVLQLRLCTPRVLLMEPQININALSHAYEKLHPTGNRSDRIGVAWQVAEQIIRAINYDVFGACLGVDVLRRDEIIDRQLDVWVGKKVDVVGTSIPGHHICLPLLKWAFLTLSTGHDAIEGLQNILVIILFGNHLIAAKCHRLTDAFRLPVYRRTDFTE